LAVSAQPDAGTQVIHILQMGHPTRVHDAKHDLCFELAHGIFAEHGDLCLVRFGEEISNRILDNRRFVIVVDIFDTEGLETGHRSDPCFE